MQSHVKKVFSKQSSTQSWTGSSMAPEAASTSVAKFLQLQSLNSNYAPNVSAVAAKASLLMNRVGCSTKIDLPLTSAKNRVSYSFRDWEFTASN